MRRLIPVLAVAFILSTLLLVASRFSRRAAAPVEAFAEQGARATFDPLYAAPDFTLSDQHGQPVSRQSLQGQVWVANFIFTQCRSVCPLLTTKMVQLQRRLKGAPVRFVSFSVDPEHDTPEVLRAYAERWAPEELRWSLLATSEATLPPLTAGFRVAAMKTTDAVDPILHTAVFLLVGPDGQVRGVFDSEHRADFEALERGARLLTGADAGVPPLPTTGEGLYHALSCANCHERPDLAPPLRELAGHRRELDNGLMAVADAVWVRESILEPDAKRVRGYPLRMPTYQGVIDDARLDTLVTWVMARGAVPGFDAGDVVPVTVDPVCHMAVRASPDAPHVDTPDGVITFCSDYCKERYLANP